MGSLMNEAERQAILGRLDRITPRHSAKWGSLSAHGMLCHLGDQLAVATGDLPTVRQDNWLSRLLGKWLVIRSPINAPKGKVPTSPEMLATAPTEWEADLARCRALAARVGSGEGKGIHPAFGPLSASDWARLSWKHMDHHIRQFGA